MWKVILITVAALLAVDAAPQQFYYSAPLVASPYTSAAYYSPTAQLVAAPVGPTPPLISNGIPATVPVALPAVPAAYPANAIPYSSVSAYSYGSSYNIQDYLPVVNPAPTSLAYSLPYAYAGDYYYRQ